MKPLQSSMQSTRASISKNPENSYITKKSKKKAFILQNKSTQNKNEVIDEKDEIQQNNKSCQELPNVLIDQNINLNQQVNTSPEIVAQKKPINKQKLVSNLTLGLFALQLVSFVELIGIILSLVVLNNDSTKLQSSLLLAVFLISRLWKIIYFLHQKMYKCLLFCFLMFDYLAIQIKVENLKVKNQTIEIFDKNEREEYKIQIKLEEKKKQQYLEALHKGFDQNAILRCQGKSKTLSVGLFKITSKTFSKQKTLQKRMEEIQKACNQQEQKEEISKNKQQQNLSSIIPRAKQEMIKKQKFTNTAESISEVISKNVKRDRKSLKQQYPHNQTTYSTDYLSTNHLKNPLSLDSLRNPSEAAQDILISQKDTQPVSIEICNTEYDCERMKTETTDDTQRCLQIQKIDTQIKKIAESQQNFCQVEEDHKKDKKVESKLQQVGRVRLNYENLNAQSNRNDFQNSEKNKNNEIISQKNLSLKNDDEEKITPKNNSLFIDMTKIKQDNGPQEEQQRGQNLSKWNFLKNIQNKITNKIEQRFVQTKSLISFSEFYSTFKKKIHKNISTKYEEKDPDESVEEYFFQRKWSSIYIRVIDGFSLSGPALILIAYWQSINCDGIDQKSKNILNFSFWCCSFCLALSLCLLSSIQYIPLRNTDQAKIKELKGMIKEFLALLANIVYSSLSIALSLSSSNLMIILELLTFGFLIKYFWNIISKFQKEAKESAKKNFIYIKIFGIGLSPFVVYMLLICTFQINFSSEFMDAALPQLLLEIPKLSLYEITQFSYKFQLIVDIINKILQFYPIHALILLIFDFFQSRVYQNFSQDTYIQKQRQIAWVLWLSCALYSFLKYRQYTNFAKKLDIVIQKNKNELMKQLEEEYFLQYNLLKEKEQLLDQALEKIQTTNHDIIEAQEVISDMEENSKNILQFINRCGNKSGENVLKSKLMNFKKQTHTKIELNNKINKLEKEKDEAQQFIIDQKDIFQKLSQKVQELADKLQKLGIDTNLNQQCTDNYERKFKQYLNYQSTVNYESKTKQKSETQTTLPEQNSQSKLQIEQKFKQLTTDVKLIKQNSLFQNHSNKEQKQLEMNRKLNQ